MTIERTTTVVQKLETKVSLGGLPDHRILPLTQLRRKSDGVVLKVNTKDYPSDKYSERDYIDLGEVDRDEGIPVPDQTTKVHDSLYTADDLATMKIKELRGVPEYTRIPDEQRRSLRTKQEYVDAILAQRRDATEAPGRVSLD